MLATDDDVARGTVDTELTVSVPNVASDQETITITDNDTPSLSLALRNGRLQEGQTDIGVVARNTPTDSPLSVSLTSSNPRIIVPRTVEIPAGATSVEFIVQAVNDNIPTVDASVTITATAGSLTATKLVLLSDDDKGTVIVAPTSIRTAENGGTATFTVRLGFRPAANVIIPLAVTLPRTNTRSNAVTLSTQALTFTRRKTSTRRKP